MTRARVKKVAPSPIVHPDYQVLPPLSAEEYAALKEDIRVSGRVRDPVITTRDGTVLDGHNRVQAWTELRAEGVELPDYPRLVRQDLADGDDVACRAAARQYNLQRRHLDRTARRAVIADQLRETPERADEWIAGDLGTSRSTVKQVRGEMVSRGLLSSVDQRLTRTGLRRMVRGSATAQRHRLHVATELRQDPGRSNDWIASVVADGVSAPFVAAVRAELEATGEIPAARRRLGRDGRYLPVPHLVNPTEIPVVEQDTAELRREHARLRHRERAIDAELRKRPRDHHREPRPGWVSPGTARLTPASIVLEVADAADLREHLADGRVDLIVTSPPWNLDVGYHGAPDDHRYDTLFAADGQISRYARELYRIAGPQGRLCLNVPLQSWIDGAPRAVAHDWLDHLVRAGWRYRSTILWLKSGAGVKTSGVPVVGDGTPQQPIVGTPATDVVLVVHKGAWKLRRTGAHNLGIDDWPSIANGVWTFPAAHRERDADGIALHPAPFPEELVRRCLVLFSYQHAVIADPFIGSGTSAVVAARLGRRCYGFDISAAYIAQARARLEASLEELSDVHPG